MILAVLIVTAVFLTACNVSMAGGIAGGSLGTLLLLVLFLGGSATTQSGCIDTQPCLSYLPEDQGVGGDAGDDMEISPCLQPPLEDMGTDQGGDSGSRMDAGSDAGADATMGALSPDDRSRLREKYRDRLPDDVLARLDDDEMV
jgi:hypothetical protein